MTSRQARSEEVETAAELRELVGDAANAAMYDEASEIDADAPITANVTVTVELGE